MTDAPPSPDAPLTGLVVFGPVRAWRAGLGLARPLVRAVEARGHRAPLADPAEIPLPLLGWT